MESSIIAMTRWRLVDAFARLAYAEMFAHDGLGRYLDVLLIHNRAQHSCLWQLISDSSEASP